MPVPKRKRSRARRDSRFANKGLKETTITKCSNCQEALLPHQACRACGFYKGSQVFKGKAERLKQRTEKKSAQTKEANSSASEQ